MTYWQTETLKFRYIDDSFYDRPILTKKRHATLLFIRMRIVDVRKLFWNLKIQYCALICWPIWGTEKSAWNKKMDRAGGVGFWDVYYDLVMDISRKFCGISIIWWKIMPVLSKPGSKNPIVFGKNRDVARSDTIFSRCVWDMETLEFGWDFFGFSVMCRPPLDT